MEPRVQPLINTRLGSAWFVCLGEGWRGSAREACFSRWRRSLAVSTPRASRVFGPLRLRTMEADDGPRRRGSPIESGRDGPGARGSEIGRQLRKRQTL